MPWATPFVQFVVKTVITAILLMLFIWFFRERVTPPRTLGKYAFAWGLGPSWHDVKILCVLLLSIIVAFGAMKFVWTTTIDVATLASPERQLSQQVEKVTSWIPTRENDALYQKGTLVARVLGPQILESEGRVTFEQIYSADSLNINEEFEFHGLRLRLVRVSSMALSVMTPTGNAGKQINRAQCRIVK